MGEVVDSVGSLLLQLKSCLISGNTIIETQFLFIFVSFRVG